MGYKLQYRQGSFPLAADFSSLEEALAHAKLLWLKDSVGDIMLGCPDGSVFEGYALSQLINSNPSLGQR